MNLIRRASSILVVLCTAAAVGYAADKTRATELLARAAEQTNLWVSGTPPFRMRVRVRLHTYEGVSEGTYLTVWVAPGRSRATWEIPGYSATSVRADKSEWRYNNLSHVPLEISRVEEALAFRKLITLGVADKVGKVRQRTVNSLQVECVEVELKDQRKPESCFDSATGNLIQISWWDTKYQFADYKSFGKRNFPSTIRIEQYDRVFAELTVEELVELGSTPDAELFRPPAGAVEWPVCEPPSSYEPAKAEQLTKPKYPEEARANRLQGTLIAYAVIGTDGIPRNLVVLRRSGAWMIEPALQSFRKWRYRPATCDGKPIPVETYLTMNFKLAE